MPGAPNGCPCCFKDCTYDWCLKFFNYFGKYKCAQKVSKRQISFTLDGSYMYDCVSYKFPFLAPSLKAEHCTRDQITGARYCYCNTTLCNHNAYDPPEFPPPPPPPPPTPSVPKKTKMTPEYSRASDHNYNGVAVVVVIVILATIHV